MQCVQLKTGKHTIVQQHANILQDIQGQGLLPIQYIIEVHKVRRNGQLTQDHPVQAEVRIQGLLQHEAALIIVLRVVREAAAIQGHPVVQEAATQDPAVATHALPAVQEVAILRPADQVAVTAVQAVAIVVLLEAATVDQEVQAPEVAAEPAPEAQGLQAAVVVVEDDKQNFIKSGSRNVRDLFSKF